MIFSPKTFLYELIKLNLITKAQADSYETYALKTDLPIDQYLIQSTKIDKNTILKIKASLLNTEYVDVAKTPVDLKALNLIPFHIANSRKVLPYFYNPTNDSLYIATADPLNLNIIEYLQTMTGKRVVLALADDEDIVRVLPYAYSKQSVTQHMPGSPHQQTGQIDVPKDPTQPLNNMIGADVQAAVHDTGKNTQGDDSANMESNIESAPIAKIVNTILEFAVKSRASDIHVEPQELKTRIRYRVDGMLKEILTLPKPIHESLVARTKILSGLKIDEKRVPQDGRFTYKTKDEEVDLRISTLPTTTGEKLVIRLLKKTGGIPTLNDLGLQGTQLRILEETIKRPYGIFLVTGPTGSGKSTTLYSVLSKLNSPTVNIVTLEDPVEYYVPGVNQVQINPQAGLTFASGLRAFLRQDPNIILVGEIRDKETTQLAIQAALTGHLVFATLHTNDAATTIPRLIDLGGEPFLIASVLLGTLAQRILRRVCENCKTWYEPSPEIQTEMKNILGNLLPVKYQTEPIKLAKGAGCGECSSSGYLGRVGIFEILKITESINKLIIKGETAGSIQNKAIEEGFMTRRQDGYLKVLQGLTTIEEVLRVSE